MHGSSSCPKDDGGCTIYYGKRELLFLLLMGNKITGQNPTTLEGEVREIKGERLATLPQAVVSL